MRAPKGPVPPLAGGGNRAGIGRLALDAGHPIRPHHPPQPPTERTCRLRRQRLVEHLHRLGPRPLGYFLDEVAGGADVDRLLIDYGAIDPTFVRALGGDRLPPLVHVVAGRDR